MRSAAGMGFWRLVSVVVVGILLSQVIDAVFARILVPLWKNGSLN